MKFIAKHFQQQHVERIEKCELIEKLMWNQYEAESNPSKKATILKMIMETQPLLSAYYEATTMVLNSRLAREI